MLVDGERLDHVRREEDDRRGGVKRDAGFKPCIGYFPDVRADF